MSNSVPPYLFSIPNNLPTDKTTNTLDPVYCDNGYPIDLYSNYGLNKTDVLYSVWNSFQTTFEPNFESSQYLNSVPLNNPNAPIGPSNIFLMRHAEKDENGIKYHIDQNGVFRATQLINYINVLGKQGYPITYIITCNPCPYNTEDCSMRPQQTIMMSAFMLNIPYLIYGNSSEYNLMIPELFSGPFNGLNVLICWEHGSIQPLCLSLLNTCVNYGRISQPNADTFFQENNCCLNGNYLGNGDFTPPQQPQPDNNYNNSQLYPYWNNNTFDFIYWFNSSLPNNYFNLKIYLQPIATCYQSCHLNIGLYQPIVQPCTGTDKYYSNNNDIEDNCELPIKWKV